MVLVCLGNMCWRLEINTIVCQPTDIHHQLLKSISIIGALLFNSKGLLIHSTVPISLTVNTTIIILNSRLPPHNKFYNRLLQGSHESVLNTCGNILGY